MTAGARETISLLERVLTPAVNQTIKASSDDPVRFLANLLLEHARDAESQTIAGFAAAMATDAGRAELKTLYDTLDSDKDGKVSSKEWGRAVGKQAPLLRRFLGADTTVAQLGKAFKMIDTNGDDSLSWNEFVTFADRVAGGGQRAIEAFAAAMATEAGRAELKALYATLDADKDGKVSSKEWGKAVGKQAPSLRKLLGADATLAQIGTAFKLMDANGDGSLSWDEFTAYVDSFNKRK